MPFLESRHSTSLPSYLIYESIIASYHHHEKRRTNAEAWTSGQHAPFDLSMLRPAGLVLLELHLRLQNLPGMHGRKRLGHDLQRRHLDLSRLRTVEIFLISLILLLFFVPH